VLARRLPCLVVALAAFRAAADAPAPADYWITQADGHVQACPSMRACPDDGLLRRNADTGEIVLLTTCAMDGRCFLDECVPAGTYQYGLATPYACYASGAYWYRTASVAGPPPGCVRTLPEPAPAESVPWTDGELICASSYHRPTVLQSCGCGSGGVVLGMQGLAVALGLALAARGRARRARK
jgi:hypothetical protein